MITELLKLLKLLKLSEFQLYEGHPISSRTVLIMHQANNNNNNLIYIAPYAELQRRWATVNQVAVNRNVFRCFLKAESELQSRMFEY